MLRKKRAAYTAGRKGREHLKKPEKPKFNTVLNVVFLAFSVGMLLYFAFSDGGLADLMKYIDDFSTGWLLMAFGCMILQLLVDAWLTCLIVRISCPDYSFGSGFKTMMVGQFYNSVTPMGVAAKPMQIYSLSRQRVSVGDASAAMVQKYLIYQFTLVFYSLGLLLARYSFFSRQIPDLMLLSAVGFLVQASIIVLLMLFSKSQKMTRTIIEMVFSLLKKLHLVKDPEKSVREISEQLESFHENFQTILRHKRLLVGSFLLTFLQMTLYYAVSYCIYRAFFLSEATLFDMIAAQAVVNLASSFMPLPGGTGAAEGSFVVVFQMFFSKDIIRSAMVLWRAATYYFPIFISAPFAWIGRKKGVEPQKNRAVPQLPAAEQADSGADIPKDFNG